MACGHTIHYIRLQETTGDQVKSSRPSKSSKGGCIQLPQEDTPGRWSHRMISSKLSGSTNTGPGERAAAPPFSSLKTSNS